ncbi:unnamed protein product [Candidula unifasciata]|uniref:Uncharacterized protein n=1 Tax=Candidula unifasciata TaxID=100452 RepID=A0A8S3YRY7_9EUPU|nr:unnamed protein product [Candidula unifasciata]
MSATMCVLKEELTNDQQVPYSDGLQPATPEDGDMDPPPVINLGNATDFPYYFRRCLRNLINFCDNSTNASSNATDAGEEAVVDDCNPRDNFDVFLDTSARNKGPAYYLLNTVDDGLGDRIWTKVGYITASGKRDLKTVLWPGWFSRFDSLLLFCVVF